MVVIFCTKFHENIFDGIKRYRAETIFILLISKGHSPEKMQVELGFSFAAHRLMMLYICTKFYENILDSIKFMERTRFS